MKQIINGRILVAILILSSALSSCEPGQVSEPTPTQAPTGTSVPTSTFAPTPTFSLIPEPISVEQVNESVAAVVVEGTVQEYARCNLDAAVWGGYDIKVTVASGYTQDQSAHVFSISNGLFSEETSSENPSSPATFEGSGIVKIDDQETAFELGIPFFVTDVTIDGETINYTVISNPEISIEFASVSIERRSDSGYTVVMDTNHPFSSDPRPQHLTYEPSGDPPGKDNYLAIQKLISGTYSACLLSNQVDLGSLALGTP